MSEAKDLPVDDIRVILHYVASMAIGDRLTNSRFVPGVEEAAARVERWIAGEAPESAPSPESTSVPLHLKELAASIGARVTVQGDDVLFSRRHSGLRVSLEATRHPDLVTYLRAWAREAMSVPDPTITVTIRSGSGHG
jgi:hypothetical protein